MEINIFTEYHILEQKRFLFTHISKKLVRFSYFKKADLYLEKNKNFKKEYYDNNIEKVHLENKEDVDNSHEKYKSDLSIITDGFCS
jgi:hypothetical protein